MQKDKHNIYSKEELLKLIKEGKNAPADMDEFEREALEGLKLLDNPEVLNELNTEIDSIVAKENRKKTIYYFSAAASLLLIIGLVLFFKNEITPGTVKNEKPIASAENLKTPEELNTTPSTQLETQTTYEAKEPEALTKKVVVAKKEEHNSLLSRAGSPPTTTQENIQEGRDVNDQSVATNEVLSKKVANYEESKAAVPQVQVKQEQQKDVVTTETETTSNTVLSNGEKDNDKSKTQQIVATGNINQPTQLAFSKVDVATNASSQDKSNESVAPQKNKSAGLYYAGAPDKKTDKKSYREPAFIDGDTAFAGYAKQHLKISSPANSGVIVVEFLITKNGKAENIKIVKSLNGCDACSQDVINLIQSVKIWSPAVIDGNSSSALKKISIQYN